MHKLIGAHQTSFVPGRQAVDNIVIVQELFHTLQRKKGSKGVLLFKLDLEKVYDRVEWPFLQEIILTTSFGTHLTSLILSCISSTSLTILWNGKWLEGI